MIQKLKKKKIWIPFLIAVITATIVTTTYFSDDDYFSVVAEKRLKNMYPVESSIIVAAPTL